MQEAFKTPTPNTDHRPTFDIPAAQPSEFTGPTSEEKSKEITDDTPPFKKIPEIPEFDLIDLDDKPVAGTVPAVAEEITISKTEDEPTSVITGASSAAPKIEAATGTDQDLKIETAALPDGFAAASVVAPPAEDTSAPSLTTSAHEGDEGPLSPSPSFASGLDKSGTTDLISNPISTAHPKSSADVASPFEALQDAAKVPEISLQEPDVSPVQEGVATAASNSSQLPPATPPPAGDAAVHDALVAREFLESNPSQLTIYGLSALIDGMSDQQLAVFFRNNHFNVLLKSAKGLYILVTDQGYLYESDVVWEHLSNVDGDTELLGWNLKPFSAHATGRESSSGVNDEELPPLIHEDRITGGDGGVLGDVLPIEHVQGPHEDADFALAMQLQQEEEERVRLAEERRRAETVRRQEVRPVGAPGGRQQQVQSRPGSGTKPGKKKKSDNCTIV